MLALPYSVFTNMSNYQELKETVVPNIPHSPGIYQYFDTADNLIYVGKAKDLRKRVAQYFNPNIDHPKTRILVRQIARISFAVVDTEQDAFLLENALIKQHQPKYNIQLKDDKTYPYICVKKEHFPRIFITRQVTRDGSDYFGPYTSTKQVYTIMELIRILFNYRTCQLNLSPTNIAANKFKVCLEYHIGNCKAPCVAKQTEQEYKQIISQIKYILKGNIASVIAYLKDQMNQSAEQFQFEKAQSIKQKIDTLQDYQSKSTIVNPKINDVDVFNIENSEKRAFVSYLKVMNGTIIQTKVIELTKRLDETAEELLSFGITTLRQELQSLSPEIIVPFEVEYAETNAHLTIPQIGDKKHLLDLAKKNAFYYYKQQLSKTETQKTANEKQFEVLNQLKKDLRLSELPMHIECFDNSNFQGSFPVSSLVVFKSARPAKQDYRHFKIKTVQGPDDFATMEEVVYRRYKRLLDEEQPLPQLVVIDGGKGQLGAALNSLRKLELVGKMAIVGIAKKLEEIYVPNDPYPLHIDKRSTSLKLLQHLRNEAHRFGITFHRDLRSKDMLQSELEHIPHIGRKTADKLLVHFKSMNAIKTANLKELTKVVNLRQARAIQEFFKQQYDETSMTKDE